MFKKYNFKLTFAKNRGEYVIFSLPETNDYQTVTSLTVSKKTKIIKDNKRENEIAFFTLNDVKNNAKISFYLQTKSIRKIINKDFNINNHHNNLESDRFINGSDPKIISLTTNIIGRERRLQNVVKKLYDFTLNYLTYGKPIKGLYSYKQTMEERITDCGGFSTFLGSLLQSVNIPSRLVVGYLIIQSLLSKVFTYNISHLTFSNLLMHAWLEIRLPNATWFPLDPSIEWRRVRNLTKREGGFGIIPEDRLVVSYGEDFKIKIENKTYKIDLLQNPIYL